VQTPALNLIDRELFAAMSTPDARLIISMPPQEGKALGLDTPIATPSGWATIGELRVGDEVFGRSGSPCRVTWVSPTWNGRPCYTVRTGDGEAIIADAAHEWVARLDRRRSERIVETTLLAKQRTKNAQITGPAGLELPDADLPIDPYVLGAWLGDGSTRSAMFCCADMEIVKRIQSAGVPCRKISARYAWSLVPAGRSSKTSPVRRVLMDLGVWGNKHIPTRYLRGSVRQRLALLQGLVDTDGYVMPKGQVEFCTTIERLAHEVQHLVFTLGAKATVSTGRATLNGRDCGPKYRVRFYLAHAAWLSRKAEHCKDSSVARTRYVWAEPAESVPVRCIEVDSPDHTYLAGRSLLPTHNSVRVSRRFPLWQLTHDPDTRVVIASYEHGVARRWGRAIRDDIANHGTDLGLNVRPDLSAQSEWQLAGHEGGVYATGIGGALTGRPADLMVIDDPVKGREEADSEAFQERAWNWWLETASTRLAPGAPVVLVLTRWHHEDLAGRLRAADDGHLWRVVNIPAQAEHRPERGETDPLGREPGEYMISARGRTTAQWEAIKTRSLGRTWTSLYQGRPSPSTGGLFPADDAWARYDHPLWVVRGDGARLVPDAHLDEVELVQSWDMAFKDTKGSDFVVGQVWMRRGADAYLLDQSRDRLTFTETCHALRTLSARWPQAVAKYVEDKANGTAVINALARTVPGLIPVEPLGSKCARASAMSPLVASRNVILPAVEIAPWIADFTEECRAFPNSTHDDQVDGMSQAVNQLILMPMVDGGIVEAADLDDDIEGFEISPY
jgi:predicted phage terminase large subunit-like protein